jgi:hypothetical protein
MKLKNTDLAWDYPSNKSVNYPNNSGPKTKERMSRLSIFKLFYTEDILNHLCAQTFQKHNVSLSHNSIFVFFTVIIIAVLRKFNEWVQFWKIDPNDIFGCDFIKNLCARDQFFEIHRNITYEKPDYKGTKKMGYFIDRMNQNFKNNYDLTPIVCVDEQIEAFKGKCAFKIFLPIKPNPEGIEFYALNDKNYTTLFLL